jgi:hypothetical protein
LTYLPILLVANDHAHVGVDVTGTLANVLGVLYFLLILVIAVAAIPPMLLTKEGRDENGHRCGRRPRHPRSPAR